MAEEKSISFEGQSSSQPSTSSILGRTSVMKVRFEVEKFDGTGHFGMWQGEVLDALFQQGLDIAIEEEKPEGADETEWKNINRLACGTIRSCLSREQKYAFMKETSASKLWKALENKFMKKSGQNRLYLKKKLFRFDYLPGTTINDHITAFNQLVADLLNLDETFKDEDLALMLLASLPDEYDHLITSLLIGKDKVSFDEVCTALYSHEIRKKDKKESRNEAAEALAVRGRSQKQQKGRRGRSRSKGKLGKDECAFCHEKGHWKKDCPKLQKKGKVVSSDACVAESSDDSDFALVGSSTASHPDDWILDSACTFHMTPNRGWFSTLEELNGGDVFMGNDSLCKILGIGTIRLRNQDGSTRVLTDVRYVPDMKKNLISLGVLESKGFIVTMQNGILKVTSGALVAMKGVRKNSLYYYLGSTVIGTAAAAVSEEEKDSEITKLWHMRLGHAGEKALQILVKQGLLKGARTGKLDFCEHCVLGKQKRVSFGTALHNTKGILDYVHTDVWGPTRTPSMSGKHYYVTFVDDFSRRVWVYLMKKKDEVLGIFLKWKKMIETQTGRKIKRLRSDNGTEYTNDPFMRVCEDEGIVRHFTVRKTPQQNGVAERMNRTLLEKVRCMLSNAGLGKQFWGEAVTYACHLINRLPSSALEGKTPMEVWSGKPATDYDSLHVFGSAAYYHVTESKLDPRAKKATFMGIASGSKGYRLWCPETRKSVISRDVTFDESAMLRKVTEKTDGTSKQVEFESRIIDPVDGSRSEVDSPLAEDESEEEEVLTQEPPQQQESIAVDRPRRQNVKIPVRYQDMENLPTQFKNTVAYALSIVDDDIPFTYKEAIRSSEVEKWKEAMDEEMKSLQKNNTWQLAKLPKGKKAIGCKWVYAKKEGFPDKDGVRYKARMVAKGYAQKEGIDYNEVFSPVVKHSSIRILLALVAQLNLELVQLDVKTAFLHGNLEEEIYVSQPEGFEVAGKENWVCKLNKSLYGLKQSPRQWYKRFDQFMLQQKYTKSTHDHCVYFRKLQDGSFIYLLLYVDDMLIASKSQLEIERLKAQLHQEFEMKDLGEAKKILGMEISRDREKGKLCLTQSQYLKKVLQRFGMNEQTKPVSTPLAPHFKLSAQLSPKNDEEREYMAKVPYANAVGSLMYAMVCTRPDISHAVGAVSRYMHDPGKGHWLAVKWILRYIQNTVDVGLVFEQDDIIGQGAIGYCDSDYAGDLDKRRSTTGYVFTLARAPVSWKSTLQSTVALSTTEAEYMAVTEAVKEAIWLQGLLEDLGIGQKHFKVYCDNQSAIHLAKNQVYHARTKHIDVRYHFVREIIEEGGVQIQKIHTAENPADMMTKVVTAIKFKHCLSLINILQI
ncbi:hypothetical protein ACOSQ3_003269 [Xanthoceras sorbifolium]